MRITIKLPKKNVLPLVCAALSVSAIIYQHKLINDLENSSKVVKDEYVKSSDSLNNVVSEQNETNSLVQKKNKKDEEKTINYGLVSLICIAGTMIAATFVNAVRNRR